MSSRFRLLPWLSLCLLATGCPLTDKYALLSGVDGGSGGSGADAGSSAAGGVAAGGASASSGGAGAAGSALVAGGAQSAGTGGSSAGNGGAVSGAGSPDVGGAAGAGPSGGSAGSAGDSGSSGLSGASGFGGSSAGAGGLGGAAGWAGAAGAGGLGGDSACAALSCTVACCNSTCVDTTRDFQNCGSCGALCSAGRSCASSACTPGWVPVSAPPVGFAARWRAASVAMGSSVFIWGGEDASGLALDSGAIYSPTADTWTLVPNSASALTARVLATAVWTGSVVIVFGGGDAAGTTAYKDAAVYDPGQNAWLALPVATNRRTSALGFWDGTRAIFWGGLGSTGAAVAGADRFDLTNWTTSNLNGDPGALANPAWAWDGSTIYFEGGTLGGGRTDKVYSYSSTSDTWASLSKSLTPRSDAFGVWDGSHFVVWGGRDNSFLHNDGKFLSGTTWFNVNATGAPSARMAQLRRSGWSFQVSPGVVAFLGGQTSLTAGTLSTTGATYDVSAAKWTTIPTWPSGESHEYGAGVWTGDEFVLWGGRDGGGPTLTGERWMP